MPVVKGSLSRRVVTAFLQTYSMPHTGSGMDCGPVKSINVGADVGSFMGNDTFGVRPYVYGLSKDTTEGSPTSPCLRLEYPATFWRFRWVAKTGQRRIAVRVKQVKSFTGQRPTMIIRKNSMVGLTSDWIETAPAGTDWVTIGPVIFNFTGTDMLWVEVWNNLYNDNAPLFIDRITAT